MTVFSEHSFEYSMFIILWNCIRFISLLITDLIIHEVVCETCTHFKVQIKPGEGKYKFYIRKKAEMKMNVRPQSATVAIHSGNLFKY